MRATTRTFLRAKHGAEQFFEISWSGPDVETVTGIVGAAGRARALTSDTEARRDAWIARRVDRALREGYREADPADVPAPEPKDAGADARAGARLRDRHGLSAFKPRFATEDTPDGSKLGGTPWLAEPWPTCPVCAHPLRFVLQLRRSELPATCHWALQDDLIQLFLCDARGKPGSPDWDCQADGAGWKPFAPSTLVRQVARAGRPAGLALPALPASWIHPPERIVGWQEILDVPAFGDITLDEADLLEQELGLRCYHDDKLAGAPCWAQAPQAPSCHACRSPMRHLFQVVSRDPIRIGGDGLGWLFVCPSCREGTFTWQR